MKSFEQTPEEELRAAWQFCGNLAKAVADATDYIGPEDPPRLVAHCEAMASRLALARTCLAKVNEIRNSIIGLQAFNWSEHMYPLVAALQAAGIEGMGYDAARPYFGTMLERTIKAEGELAEARGRIAELESVAAAAYERGFDDHVAQCHAFGVFDHLDEATLDVGELVRLAKRDAAPSPDPNLRVHSEATIRVVGSDANGLDSQTSVTREGEKKESRGHD